MPEYRLVVTEARDIPRATDAIALGEIILWDAQGARAEITSLENPGGRSPRANEMAAAAADNNTFSKWLDLEFVPTGRSELRMRMGTHEKARA